MGKRRVKNGDVSVSNAFMDSLKACLVGKPNYMLVFSLVATEPRSIQDIHEETGLARTTVARILGKLKESGLVTSAKGVDRRVTYWTLTDLGRKLVDYLIHEMDYDIESCAIKELTKGNAMLGNICDFECVRDLLAAYLGRHVKKWPLHVIGAFLNMLDCSLRVDEERGLYVVCQ